MVHEQVAVWLNHMLCVVCAQVDKDFRIISDAYPYIASRLLTDPSAELQAALQQLLFTDDQVVPVCHALCVSYTHVRVC